MFRGVECCCCSVGEWLEGRRREREKDDSLGLPQWSFRLVWVRVVCWLTVELCAGLHGWRSREAKAVLHGKIGQNVGGK